MSNLSILLVDDDRDLVESLADFIELRGHNVDIALTAEEGIAAASKKDYDAILVDIGLPDINGVSTLYSIKEVKPDSRILLMTGYSSDNVVRKITPDDPLPVMTKPLDLDAMMAWLAAA
ncbi:MAG: response regulator [Alphaproteobacteria bacterium]